MDIFVDGSTKHTAPDRAVKRTLAKLSIEAAERAIRQNRINIRRLEVEHFGSPVYVGDETVNIWS